MLNKTVLFFLVLIQLSVVDLKAQSAGSPYSIFGIGDLNRFGSSVFNHLSSTGLAVTKPGYYNNLNPAANRSSNLYNSYFNLGFNISRFRLETLSETETFSRGDFTELSLMFQLNNRSNLFFGFEPFSSVNYSLDRENFRLSNNEVIDVQFRGDGGLSTIYLGTSYSISKSFSLGLRGNFYTGSINRFEEGVVDQTSTFVQTQDNLSLNGIDLTLGFTNTFEIGKTKLDLGGTYSTGSRFNTTSNFQISQNQFLVFENEDEEPDDVYVVPQKFGLGTSIQTKRIQYSLDYSYELWSEGDLDSQDSEFDDVQRVSAGFEYRNSNENLKKYIQFLTFRGGIFVQNSYLKIENTSFTEYGFSAGISLPFRGGNELSLGYQWQKTGTLDNGLIREVQQNYTFNILFRNVWFNQRKIN